MTKVPKRVDDSGRNASSTDPVTWSSFETALGGACRHGFDGIGFVFSDDDDLMGIDLDNCRDPETGQLDHVAREIVDSFDTYTEASVSGTGVHLILRGQLPPGARNRKPLDQIGVEMYSRDRYFCVTGEALIAAPVRDCQTELDALCAQLWPALGVPAQPRVSEETQALDDEALIEKAMASSGGNEFASLWRGDTSAHDGDHSRADQALLARLAFWTNCNPLRMDRLFRTSGLYRAKWERQDYREASITKACELIAGSGGGYTGSRSGSTCEAPRCEDRDPAPEATQLEDLSDTGNANVYVRLKGHLVRYIADVWWVFSGERWQMDTTHFVEALVAQALLTRFDEAAQAPDVPSSKKIAAWAASSRSAAKRRAALEVARSDRRVAARPEDLDRDPLLFNCLNGTIDLRSGELRRHDPADLITKLAPVRYDPDARSDLWERVLAEATDADAEFVATLQRIAGYMLTGDCREEVFFLFYGREATMKSTFLGALAATMGDYAMAADSEVFLARTQVGGPRDGIAGMEGARLVECAEFDRDRRMAEAQLKQLTGGDKVRARHLYQREREFSFTAKLAFHTNAVPRMSDDDAAVWRRAWVVPFEHSIPEEKRDPSVKARLCDPCISGAAILAWAVKGCLDWQCQGLGKPLAIAQATRAVRLSMDPLADFYDECCVFEPGVWTASNLLRAAYEQWSAQYRRKRLGPKEWGQRLNARGLNPRKRNGVRGWLGVRLLDAETVVATLPSSPEGR